MPQPPSWDAFNCFLTIVGLTLAAVTLLVALVSAVLIVVGWISYRNLVRDTRSHAETIARTAAENETRKYLDEKMPGLIEKWVKYVVESERQSLSEYPAEPNENDSTPRTEE